MTTVFLITVTDADADHVARWVERDGGLRLCPQGEAHPGFGVPAIDVVREPEGPAS